MAEYVELGGLRTWYEERGEGEPLVLLHPGMTDARAWEPNIEALAARFKIFTPERRAHGHTPDVDGPLSFEDTADDTAAFLEQVVGGPAHLAGCSDGATVALLTALRRPELARRVALIAGVFHHQGWIPEAIDPDLTPPRFMAEAYGEISPDGVEHYPVVVEKMAQMHQVEPALTTADLARIKSQTLVMVGDDDEVTLEHAVALYRGIPDAELAVVPRTSHGLLVEKADLCNQMLLGFLAEDPIETLAPIRRRG